jgi:hypothetical protein
MMGSLEGFQDAGSQIARSVIGSGSFEIARSPRITWEYKLKESRKGVGRAMGFGREVKCCPDNLGAAVNRPLTIAVTPPLWPAGGG